MNFLILNKYICVDDEQCIVLIVGFDSYWAAYAVQCTDRHFIRLYVVHIYTYDICSVHLRGMV